MFSKENKNEKILMQIVTEEKGFKSFVKVVYISSTDQNIHSSGSPQILI